MAGPASKTRNWRARENAHKPAGLHLIVTGEVEVSATNKLAELAEASHDGKVLALDLTIVDSDTADDAENITVWTCAYLHRVVTANEFERVQIRRNGEVIATVPVIDDSEHDALLAKETQAQNAVAKAATKKPAASKAVSRVVAAVENAVGDLAEGAKKALKRVFKKAPKKSAKKSAKAAATKSAGKTAKSAKKSAKKAPKKSAQKSTKKSAKTSARKSGRPVRKAVKKMARKAAPRKAKKGKKRR